MKKYWKNIFTYHKWPKNKEDVLKKLRKINVISYLWYDVFIKLMYIIIQKIQNNDPETYLTNY